MRGKRQKESSVTCWYGGFGKQRILSLMLCAALLVGTCVPEYSMSVHAADISDEEVIYNQEEENISYEEVSKASDKAMEKSLTVTMSKAEYEVGSVLKPEDLTVEYRGADGEIIVLSYKSDDSVSGYTISGADTNTLGDRVMTVSYYDGTDTLTRTVNYTVYGVLTDAMVTMPDWEYYYNGEEHKPEPVVKYADDVVLKPEEDYSVSYADNIDAGEAAVSISGKGVYRGTVTKKFMITKATFGEVNLSREESCWSATQGYWDLRGYFSVEAASGGGGFTGRSIGEIIEYNDVTGGEGNVLSEMPYIDQYGILRYSTKAGTAGDSVLIPIIVSFGKNYNDAKINITISLKDGVSGAYEGITWKIEADGKLTVEGTGEFSKATSTSRAPWYNYRKKIETAEIRVTGMQDASYMFYGCDKLTSIDVSGFDTSSVTNMPGMFGI